MLFESSVDQFVFVIRRRVPEILPTLFAAVLCLVGSRVDVLVLCTRVRRPESLVTVSAFEGFLSSVDPFMIKIRTGGGKSFPAQLTGVEFFSGVDVSVCGVMTQLTEALPTFLAGVRFHSGVDPFVHSAL